MKRLFLALVVIAACTCAGCKRNVPSGATLMAEASEGNSFARYFSIFEGGVSVMDPFTQMSDTLFIDKPLTRIVCMSTTHLAYLDAIGCAGRICGVSGLKYVSSQNLPEDAVEVGYEAEPDYEAILKANPQVVLAYSTQQTEPPYIQRLRDLGIRVLTLHDQREHHPLSRAEYIRLAGALCGCPQKADSLFDAISAKYKALTVHSDATVKVLMNIPYADQWYVPGGESYMARLLHDAGASILGAEPSTAESSVISIEKALKLASEADYWFHPGICTTKEDLFRVCPLFKNIDFKGIYNNTRRLSPGGGNDFWESGAARPDLILEDLRAVFTGSALSHYYIEVN